MDNPSVVNGYIKCTAVGQAKGIRTSTKNLEGEALTQKSKPASSNCISWCEFTIENVRTSTKALSSNARYNHNLVRAVLESVTFYKGNRGLSGNSLTASLLFSIHSRDTFAALFSTQPFLAYKYHFSPTESQHPHSKYAKTHISMFQDFSALKNLPLNLQNSQNHVTREYNRNSTAYQKKITYADHEDTYNSGHSSHIIEHSSLATRLPPLQETQRNSDHPDLNRSQVLRKSTPFLAK